MHIITVWFLVVLDFHLTKKLLPSESEQIFKKFMFFQQAKHFPLDLTFTYLEYLRLIQVEDLVKIFGLHRKPQL